MCHWKVSMGKELSIDIGNFVDMCFSNLVEMWKFVAVEILLINIYNCYVSIYCMQKFSNMSYKLICS